MTQSFLFNASKHLMTQSSCSPRLLLCITIHTHNREDHHKGKAAIPETRGVEDGSTKRNIQRKHSHDPHAKEKKQGGGGGGKGKWDPLNDGSME